MTMIEDLRKTVADRTPVYALIGATDALVGRARQLGVAAGAQVVEKVHQVRRDADHKSLQAMAQQLPSRAVDSGLHLVARAEETYEDLAERGAQLLNRRRDSKSPVAPTEPQVRREAVVIDPPTPSAPTAANAPGAAKTSAPKARKAAAKPRVTKPATAKPLTKPSKSQAAAKTAPAEPAKPTAD